MQLLKFNKIHTTNKNKSKSITFFSNPELKSILQLYSKQVAKGVCKDYAIDYKGKIAIFSFYKHTFDKPIFKIEKVFQKKNYFTPIFLLKYNQQIFGKSTSLNLLIKKLDNKFETYKLKNIS